MRARPFESQVDHPPNCAFNRTASDRQLHRRQLGITLLDLIKRFLDQDIVEDMRQWTPISGVPQGSVLSPLLSNLYLHPFDDAVSKAGYQIVRYCDDFVILCRTQAEAGTALALVQFGCSNTVYGCIRIKPGSLKAAKQILLPVLISWAIALRADGVM